MSSLDERIITALSVVHVPHQSIYTGVRHLTVEQARVEISVTLSDGSVQKFAVIRTPQRSVRRQTKIDLALTGFEPIIGMKWSAVQRVALRFQFLPLGIPWGIRYSGIPRWFHCFCDGNTLVEKAIWKDYQAGRVISITCAHCTLTQSLKKT